MESQPGSHRGLLLAAFAAVYITWGSTYLGIRIAIETIPPFLMLALRYLIAGIILYVWARRHPLSRVTLDDWKRSAIVGALLLLGGNGAVAWAVQTIPSGLASLIVAMAPLWMALLDWVRPGGTRPRTITAIGIVVGLVGVGLLVRPDAASTTQVDPAGVVVILIGTLCWSIGSLYSRGAALPSPPILSSALQMLTGGVLLLIVSAVGGELGEFDPSSVSLRSILALAYLITFGSLIGYSAYLYLLRNTTTARASTYAFVNPVVAVFLGWLVLDEAITSRMLLAAAAIVVAVVLIVTGQMRKK